MSERRTTAIAVQVEYRPTRDSRTTAISAKIEYKTVKERRTTTLYMMVEIGSAQLVLGHAGPRVQMMI